MADCSEVEDLMLISGDGECEMSLCDTDKEPTGDVCLARLRARPQPLSMETLQGARDGLERCGELGEELGSCLDLALERFCREPLYVQENARLLIRWDGGELEFVSGEGQCDISVCYMDSEPHYHITAQTGDVYLTWLLSHPEPLSSANLASVRDSLESCGVMGEELRNCFNLALQEFHREPPCVQANAKMLIQCKRGSLEFLSGEGECEISVRYRDGKPHYDVGELPMHMYLDRLHAQPEPLSADTLWKVWRKLVSCRREMATLRACISHALDQFILEPQCVQENARLLIQWDGEELEFISGQGQCEISVLLADGRPQYHITELGGDRPVTWSHASPEPLSVADLARVRVRLGHWGVLGEELSGCFGEAISQFSQEPPCVQGNARMKLCSEKGRLKFLSGEGECEISVHYRDGRPQYKVGELPVHMYLDRLRAHPEPLSANTLWRVLRKLLSCQGYTSTLRACVCQALDQFVQEPRRVQENARLLIRCDGQELEFVSGRGQCEISVLLADGEPQYHITELGGDRPVTWSHSSPEPLSVADLARVRDRLGRWRALGEELSGCFGEAISQFSREPPCVQENTRLRLCWYGGSLEFLSGEGLCEISVCYRDGRLQYDVGQLPIHMYLDRLRANPPPLSSDILLRVCNELQFCEGDTEALRACLERARDGFCSEPISIQNNSKLTVQCDQVTLEFTSGEGENEIKVCRGREGEIQYTVKELEWWERIARLFQ